MSVSLSAKPFYLLSFFILSLLLCSFSLSPVVKQQQAPIEKKASSKRQKRLNKRLNRLYKHFDQAKSSKKQAQIQKKIRHIERQQNSRPTPIVSIVGLGLAIIGFMFFFAAALYFFSGLALATFAVIFALAGLITSAVAVALCKKFPERYFMRGVAIFGIILGSVIFTFSIIYLAGRI